MRNAESLHDIETQKRPTKTQKRPTDADLGVLCGMHKVDMRDKRDVIKETACGQVMRTLTYCKTTPDLGGHVFATFRG